MITEQNTIVISGTLRCYCNGDIEVDEQRINDALRQFDKKIVTINISTVKKEF